MSDVAFQDQGSVHHCFGCGAGNEKGLQLKSYWDGDEAVARWLPLPHCCGGTQHNVNGGIIAALIDCHSLNLAIANAYRLEQRPIGTTPRIGYVTANLNVDYLKPTPVEEWLELRAVITKLERRKAYVRCELHAAKVLRACGFVLGVRVDWS